MKSRSRKRPRVPANPVAATALKVDPTRTLTLRRGVCTEVSKRLAKVRLQVHDLLVRQQALRFRWATLPTEGKVNAVTNWVTTLLREALLPPGNWWVGKLLAAYMRGASRSHDDVRRRNPQLAALGAGGKGEFLRGLVRRRALPRPVTNAFNPDQPRGKHTGRWVKLSDAVVGQPRDKPLRGHDHPDLELQQASAGAKDATDRAVEETLALLKYRFPNDADLRREYWESMFLGIETFAPWRQQQYPVSIRKGAKHTLERSVQAQAGMAAGNVRQAMYEGRTSGVAASQHTLAKEYHDYLARAINHQGRMWLVSSIKDHNVKERVNKRLDEVVKRHQEAAALHHDAAEMLADSGWPRTQPAAVRNAFNPDQPRGEHTGRWIKLSDAVVGQLRTAPMRGKDTPEQEAREASAGATYASHYLRKNGGISLLDREVDTAANRTDLTEEDRRSLISSLQMATRRTYGAHNLSSEIEDNLRDPTDQLNETWRLHHLAAQVHRQAAELLHSAAVHSNNSALLKLWAGHHREAAALHHDAAEMWHGGPVDNTFNPDQPRDNHGRWERLSDSAHRPYGFHPEERTNQKYRPSPLEDAVEASEAAHEVSLRAGQLTDDLINRVLNDQEVDYAHDHAHEVRRSNMFVESQAQLAKDFRTGNNIDFEEQFPGQFRELSALHHEHAQNLHRKVAYLLGHLHRTLAGSRHSTTLDLQRRHRDAAALHHDAAEMLGNPHLTLRPPVANATPYVSPDDVETYGGRLQALAHRLRNELDGVTWAAAQRIARVLHDGLDQGWGAERLAQAITDAVDSIARSRALLIANTELIRAHADGQLDALEELGEEEVTAAVEWATAGDDRVCKLCKPLDGVVLTVAEARGLIPRHVNCRCAWLPAGTRKGQDGKVMQSTLQDVTRAVKRSLRKAPANDGWFEGKAVARKRPKV